jgi:hypothetical protein
VPAQLRVAPSLSLSMLSDGGARAVFLLSSRSAAAPSILLHVGGREPALRIFHFVLFSFLFFHISGYLPVWSGFFLFLEATMIDTSFSHKSKPAQVRKWSFFL